MRATIRLSRLEVGKRGQLLNRRQFIVTQRWPEDRGPGYTEVQFDDGQMHTFCWDYENPDVQILE
jgi:hypothetical protein